MLLNILSSFSFHCDLLSLSFLFINKVIIASEDSSNVNSIITNKHQDRYLN